ncbi:MAG: PilN domain-containing protein [Deltaproteobacteria bacterium]|nr:PilN domain-containing protein [Deltaproteobacteria bacterium]
MIKINLLPQKRAKRSLAAVAGETAGGRELTIGIGALVAAAVLVFIAVDMPKRSRLHALEDSNADLQKDIAAKQKQLVGYPELQKAYDEAIERTSSIKRLEEARVVPANVLHELGEILTPNHLPTMTAEMARKTGTGTDSDPNKRFDYAWDPVHVWLTSLVEQNDGTLRIEGGAQTEVDITQFSKRLAASAYFADIAPASETRDNDKDSGIDYFHFTITGKVAY